MGHMARPPRPPHARRAPRRYALARNAGSAAARPSDVARSAGAPYAAAQFGIVRFSGSSARILSGDLVLNTMPVHTGVAVRCPLLALQRPGG